MTTKIWSDDEIVGLPVMEVRGFLRRVASWHGRFWPEWAKEHLHKPPATVDRFIEDLRVERFNPQSNPQNAMSCNTAA